MTYKIVSTGMGGFMNPPGHAEHSYHVQEGLGRNAGSMSLSYALTSDYVPTAIKTQARQLLDANPGTYTPEWEESCYAYWRNCWSPDGSELSSDKLIISSTGDPERHGAYLHIKEYFSDAKPRLDLIANPPVWGKKSA